MDEVGLPGLVHLADQIPAVHLVLVEHLLLPVLPQAVLEEVEMQFHFELVEIPLLLLH